MARVIIHSDGKSRIVELGPVPVSFGRGAENTVMLTVPDSSRRHFQIDQIASGFKLTDLESRNGTRVNGRVQNSCILRHGDQIEIGPTTITFDDPDSVGSHPVAPSHPQSQPGHHDPRINKSTARSKFSPRMGQRPSSAAGGIILAVIIAVGALVAISLGTKTTGEEDLYKETFDKATAIEDSDPVKALALFREIPEQGGTWYRRASSRIIDLNKRLADAPPPGETRDFKALEEFVEKNLAKHEEIVRRSEEFNLKYPHSSYGPQVNAFLDSHRSSKAKEKILEVERAERKADEAAARSDFVSALGEMDAIYERFKTDIDVKARLVKKRNSIVDKGKLYAKDQTNVANKLLGEGKKMEARDVYLKLCDQLGNGNVPDFADQCRVATLNIDSIKP